MADSVTQPDTNGPDSSCVDEQDSHTLESRKSTPSTEQFEAEEQQLAGANVSDTSSNQSRQPIIWTPRFITAFALVFAIGMSVNSVLSQDWAAGYGREFWILLTPIVIVLGGWIAALVIVPSRWVRLGSIFGCIWATFTALGQLPIYIHALRTLEIVASTNALTSCSLLGLSICLSMNRTSLRRWDTWFFRLAIPSSIGIAVIPYALSFAANPLVRVLESDSAFSAVLLSLAIWWLRPSCWRSQPGPTLLFGIAPAILLYLALPGTAARMTNVFFLETLDLCMFLGILRVIQGELRWKQYLQSRA